MFFSSLYWTKSNWLATSYRWHPQSAAPPVMGLVFADRKAAHSLFRSWTDAKGHEDELDELRVAIVEGDVPGQAPGYSVHLCPDPEAAAMLAAAHGRGDVAGPDVRSGQVGQVRRMHPQWGNAPDALPTFKKEYAKHGMYLLCPVTQGADGQFYFDHLAGIEKTTLHLRRTEDITGPDDIDWPVMQPPPPPALATPIFEAL